MDSAAQTLSDRVYLVDGNNATGYAQVLTEYATQWTSDPDGRSPVMSYTLGDDVLAQTNASGTTHSYLYDGLGSTRALATDTGAIATDSATPSGSAYYDYDAYGKSLGADYGATSGHKPLATHMYTGEQYDTDLQQTYLRARYYNASNGRFNRLDPFAGDELEPQSLHKYAYVHGDPINGRDPSGLVTLAEIAAVSLIVGTLGAILAAGDAYGRGGDLRDIITAAASGYAFGAILGPASLVPFLGTALAIGGVGLGAYATWDAYANENNIGLTIYRGVLTATGLGLLGYARYRYLKLKGKEPSSLEEAGATLAAENAVGPNLSSAAGRMVYRHVPATSSRIADARMGKIAPRGRSLIDDGVEFAARADLHDSGFTHQTGLTSWTVDKTWAIARLQRLGGVIVEAEAPTGAVYYNVAAKGAESQVLIEGAVQGRVFMQW